MPHAGDRWVHPRSGTTLEVLRTGPIEIRKTVKPGNGKLKAHYHLDYTETFIVEQGRGRIKTGRRTIDVGPGDQIVVERGEPHINMWNPGTDDLAYRATAEPTPPFIDAFIDSLGACLEAGRTDRQDELPLSVIFALAHRLGSETYATGMPRVVQRRVLAPLGALVARARRYPVAG